MEKQVTQRSWGRPTSVAGAVRLLGKVAAALVFGVAVVVADDGRSAGSPASRPFGTVTHIHGDVSATATIGGARRSLKVGDAVFVGDRVRAEPAAEALMKTVDAGRVAIRPGTDFVAEHVVAEGKPSDAMTVRLIAGSLRVITGWISRVSRANHKLVTPTATIGIRGTDHEPYVLSVDRASATGHKPGTYDKVNLGNTTMIVGDNRLDIASGQVGFVREAAASDEPAAKTRLLLTILMPVLLDKVPDFYVPGRFDAEMERYSRIADSESRAELSRLQKTPVADTLPVKCDAPKLARAWLRQLDLAAIRGDSRGIVAKFAPSVSVRATVRNTDGTTTTVTMGRDELATSTVTALKGLTDYRHRRVSVEAATLGSGHCSGIHITSVVVESGRQRGKPYRFESVEEYVIESQGGKWFAVEAATTQR